MTKQLLSALALFAASTVSFAQDDCSSAVAISGQGLFNWDNSGYADGQSTSCGTIAGDYWFEWTADETGTVTVSNCGLGVNDTKIAARDGCNGAELACVDDSCDLQSTISFPATAGEIYYLQLGHFNSDGRGSEVIHISFVASIPDNDDCATAEPVFGECTVPWNNFNAEDDGLGTSCGSISNDVWFLWTAPADGFYQADTCDTLLDTMLAVWDGSSGCPPAIELDCNDDYCGSRSRVFFEATGGSTYYFQVGSRFSFQEVAGELRIQADPCGGAVDDGLEENDDCSSAVQMSSGFYPDLFTAWADEDWYSIDVADGETLRVLAEFSHAEGDIDMELYDACSGTLLATSVSITDDEELLWSNTTGNTVSTKAAVFYTSRFDPVLCNTYDLSVILDSSPFGVKYCAANANSTGSPADMVTSGSASSDSGDLTLDVMPVPNNSGVFFHGELQSRLPFGNGFLCAVGDLRRGLVVSASGNVATYTYDNSIPKKDLSSYVGSNRNFQYWYRDPMGGGALYNVSNAISVDILP